MENEVMENAMDVMEDTLTVPAAADLVPSVRKSGTSLAVGIAAVTVIGGIAACAVKKGIPYIQRKMRARKAKQNNEIDSVKVAEHDFVDTDA